MLHERDRFNRFTERARRVLSLAQEEAQRFNHNYIGTEHLLLGLIREDDGVAARVLNILGIELKRVRDKVEVIIGRGDRIVLGEISLTPRAKKVIELAVDEARRFNHPYIGTEHLLLGLVREGDGIAAGVLQILGVTLEEVRTTTMHIVASTAAPPQATAGFTPPLFPRTPRHPEPHLFISYRAAEAADLTRTIAELFVAEFGAHHIARHVDAAPLGTDVRAFVRQQVRKATVLLVIIGPAWLSGPDEGAPRPFDEHDEVQLAIDAALRYHKPIIPVLVQDATLPAATALPEGIRDILFYQGTQLRSDPYLHDDIARLIAEIRRIFVEGYV